MKSFSLLWLAAAYLLSMATARITFAEDTLSFVQACDSMAADIEDSQGGSKGLWDYQVKAKEAVDTCGKAARKGFAHAMIIEARLSELNGTQSGKETAGRLYHAPAEKGYLPAIKIVAFEMTDLGPGAAGFDTGLVWLRRASDAGDRESQLRLAEYCVYVSSVSCEK
ncbi:MAG TPA: hypothetical protein VND94_08600 [Terriglobia bacterium]|nr:hypothetical protein [Terriglobia bacterium]